MSIRTFRSDAGQPRFGTGAGITGGSEPDAEWAETRLEARRLTAPACGQDVSGDDEEEARWPRPV